MTRDDRLFEIPSKKEWPTHVFGQAIFLSEKEGVLR
jgi:hypothetical protein